MKSKLSATLAHPTAYLAVVGMNQDSLHYHMPIKAQYLVDVNEQIMTLTSPAIPLAQAYIQADEKRHVGFDRLLTNNFDKLVDICAEVQVLRKRIVPAIEPEWATVVRKAIDIGVTQFKTCFDEAYEGEPMLAMPRAFARKPEDIFVDTVGHPRLFKPGRCVYIPRMIPGFRQLPLKQQRSLMGKKRFSARSRPALPVLAMELKKGLDGLSEAEGQSMYSVVQAAGIYANCAISLQTLILPVAHGFVSPMTSSWEGGSVCVVRDTLRADLDLGELRDIVTLVLMVRTAVLRHLQAAFEASIADLDAVVSFKTLTAIPLSIGPHVDWRSRVAPQKTNKTKRSGNDTQADTPPRKKARSAAGVEVGDDGGAAC
ncbi:hypothetical protein C8J57DRAFT_255100 [Mycena rebaudengoi]|nr:hypothetical protein C8J57DRAFT_255100 [Mycena rebaudengoi]